MLPRYSKLLAFYVLNIYIKHHIFTNKPKQKIMAILLLYMVPSVNLSLINLAASLIQPHTNVTLQFRTITTGVLFQCAKRNNLANLVVSIYIKQIV